jgi:hypothetical protein
MAAHTHVSNVAMWGNSPARAARRVVIDTVSPATFRVSSEWLSMRHIYSLDA